MQAYEGIYENGVVRFPAPISLPEHTKVTVTPQSAEAAEQSASSLDRLYKLLEQSVETGIPDLAARHNEHQP
jgi:hypothetical protein